MSKWDKLKQRRREFIGATLLVAVSTPFGQSAESDSEQFGYGGTRPMEPDVAVNRGPESDHGSPPPTDTDSETDRGHEDDDTEASASSDDQFDGGFGSGGFGSSDTETSFGKGQYGYGDHGYGGVLSE